MGSKTQSHPPLNSRGSQSQPCVWTYAYPGFREKDPVRGVKYFTYAGSGLDSALLFPTHILIDNAEGPNDGMVSVQSATWPAGLTEGAWNDADHFAEVGYDLNRPDLTTTFDLRDAIARVVARATS